MNDERLDAGRFHLHGGETALADRDWFSARDAFEAALLQFAGPDLRIGAAHALRGLALVHLAEGELAAAEAHLRDAIKQYREVRKQIDQLDGVGVATETRTEALEGEAVAQVHLGDLLLRTGRDHEARDARDWAVGAFDALPKTAAVAGLLALSGRLSLREGALEDADAFYQRALAAYEGAEDHRGRCAMLQALAEVRRLEGNAESARQLLTEAKHLAKDHGDAHSEARALAGLGSLAMQVGDPDRGVKAYERVLVKARELDDDELQGFAHLNLGQLYSFAGGGDALKHLREAVALLGALGISHAVGAAMHHVATHALYVGEPLYALAAAESARRLWRSMDPIRGVSQAMRLQVKALKSIERPAELLAVASARANLVGDQKPKVIEVRDYYRARTAPEIVAELDALNAQELYLKAEDGVAKALESFLDTHGWTLSELSVTNQALALIDALNADTQETDEVQLEGLSPLTSAGPIPAESILHQRYFVLSEDEETGMTAVPVRTGEDDA